MTSEEQRGARGPQGDRKREGGVLIRSIAVSMASFIAEIDSSSSDVADYIEQRLQPLAEYFGARSPLLRRVAADTRKLKRDPTAVQPARRK